MADTASHSDPVSLPLASMSVGAATVFNVDEEMVDAIGKDYR